MLTMKDYQESADYIKEKIKDFSPEIMIVLGSGLGFLADECQDAVTLPYQDIPHFRTTSVEGHTGALIFGRLCGRRVMLMQGRIHIYEGYTAEESAYAVRVAKLLGIRLLLLTNASGGINPSYQQGDLMLITDHIKMFSPTPLWGPNLSEFGPRFPDMTQAYSKRLLDVARTASQKTEISIQEGVYFYAPGPQYETPAEIHAMRILGGDAVGMSTVNETIAAVHCGMEVLGFSVITDMASGMSGQTITHEEVMAAAAKAQARFSKLILSCIEMM